MRSLIIATVSLLLLVAVWGGFMYYTHDALSDLQVIIEEEVMESIRQGDWESADERFHHVTETWNSSKHIYSYFMDTAAVKEADVSLASAAALIESRDEASAMGELSRINRQLHYIYNNEKPTLENIL